MKIYSLHELNKYGQDINRVDELTEEIVNLRNQLQAYKERRDKITKIYDELNWLDNCSIDLQVLNKGIFELVIDKAVIYSDGKINFIFIVE